MTGSVNLRQVFTTGRELSYILRRLDLINRKMIQSDYRRFGNSRANHPAAGKAGIALLSAVERHRPGLPEPVRSASLVESHEGPTDLPLDTATSAIPTYGLRVAPD